MKRLDEKLARIRAGQYRKQDFIIADAKDPDMGPSLTWTGPKREPDGSWTRYRTREEFLDQIRAIVRQGIVDIMLMSASNMERLTDEGLFKDSPVKPAIRANDTTDIWRMRGAQLPRRSRRARSARPRCRGPCTARQRPCPGRAITGTDLGLYSITFNNDLDADLASLEAFAEFRAEAAACGFKYFLEVFNPNVETGIDPEILPHYINDNILRCLAGVHQADRPQFLKIAYNGPKALEELTSFDPSVVVGVLGGGAGTTRDCFELLHQAEKYGARVALFGRKINLAEAPLAIVAMMREVVDGNLSPQEAVRAYHGELQKQRLKPQRPLEDDMAITEAVLQQR